MRRAAMRLRLWGLTGLLLLCGAAAMAVPGLKRRVIVLRVMLGRGP